MNRQQLMRMPLKNMRGNIKGLTKPFYYGFPPTSIAAGTTVGSVASEIRLNIDADAQFYCYTITGSYHITNAASGLLLTADPLLHAEPQIQVIDESSGARMFEKPLLWGNIVGTAKRPLRLNKPFPFTAGGTLIFQVGNPETLAYVVTLSLNGAKVFVR